MTAKKPRKAGEKAKKVSKGLRLTRAQYAKSLVKGRRIEGPTPERTEQLCVMLRMGMYLETCAPGIHITTVTLRNWIGRAGRAEDPPSAADAPYVEFFNAIQEASAEAEHRVVGSIAQAAAGAMPMPVLDKDGEPILDGKGRPVMTPHVAPDWKAAAWLAERKWQGRWAQTRKIDVRVQQGMEQLLDAVRGRMPAKSYRDLIHALDEVRQAELRGDTEVS